MWKNADFGGGPSDTASTFLKMGSADGCFPYEDDTDAVITITITEQPFNFIVGNTKLSTTCASIFHFFLKTRSFGLNYCTGPSLPLEIQSEQYIPEAVFHWCS